MNVSELADQVMAFQLDDPRSSLPFTSRLAREQNWTHAYAGAVVREYKRFLVLAVAAGHPVTPSEDVDQAWHLHLLYTRSYWIDLCQDTLGQDLHHGPTRGGPEESEKFVDWYERTLESYRRLFSTEPPEEIWPKASKRFDGPEDRHWIDRRKVWTIPKPQLLKPFFKK